MGAEALKTVVNDSVNTTELLSGEATYLTSPILDTTIPPYILDNKLFASFNSSIVLKEWEKVKVYKNPPPGNDGDAVPLKQDDISLDSKKILIITLPEAVTTGKVLPPEAGCRGRQRRETIQTTQTRPSDLPTSPSGKPPVLDKDKAPYLSGQKIIVTFDSPISILDPRKIKYQLDGTPVAPDNEPKLENNNQLEIPLNDPLVDGQVYRINLEAGALGGGKKQALCGEHPAG